jgi:hypothetical protein
MRYIPTLTLVAVACATGIAYPAAAQQPAGALSPVLARLMAICQGDLQKLCANVQPGGGRILQCMAQHQNEISQPCKQAIIQARNQNQGQGQGQTPAQPPGQNQTAAPAQSPGQNQAASPSQGPTQTDLGFSP